MPPLVVSDEDAIRKASLAEILYLLNISFLPVAGFILLLLVKTRIDASTHPLARSHIRQCINASIWAGLLMIGINALIFIINGLDNIWSWMFVILYLISIHSALILLGVTGLSKAQGGQYYAYPLLSKTCHDDDLP